MTHKCYFILLNATFMFHYKNVQYVTHFVTYCLANPIAEADRGDTHYPVHLTNSHSFYRISLAKLTFAQAPKFFFQT